MASRGQKRTEVVDEFPADKRACSSLESRAGTSNSPISSAHEGGDADMDASSSTSGSTRSEGEEEKDSPYGSCESDYSIRDYYRHRLSNDVSQFKKVLSGLSEEVEESVQLALLTELCELLSFCSDSTLSNLMADSLSPILVRLASHHSNPDIMLLSVRALTYLCDVNPPSSAFLVRHDAVPALCERLMAIEYLDVAEQCLQALEKISREQPLACLQSGAIMAVLRYIDFFSTSVQRIALSTVVNTCKKLSSDSPSLFMDAVPILCNLLQYEDRKLVESAVTSLIKIGEQAYRSSDMLDEICKHGLVQHAIHLIGINSRTTLCQQTHIGLIGLLVKLVSESTIASITLFELNISNIAKDMLSTYNLSPGTQSTPVVDEPHSQTQEVLKLLNELLPTVPVEQDVQPKTEKETFLLNHPDILKKFGLDLLPILIQVVNSGADLFICHGCLSVINKLVHVSIAEDLHSLLPTSNFSSFLAGVFTRKDRHVILLALQIVDSIMLKLPHVFFNSFVKEGVLFAIYSLVLPDNDVKLSAVFGGIQSENEETQKTTSRNAYRCPCFTFDTGQSRKSPKDMTCKLHKDAVQNLAKRIWGSYFESESRDPEKGVTATLQELRALSSALMTMVNKCNGDVSSTQEEENIYDLLYQIVSKLNHKDSMSTFEFVESGIIKALVIYLSGGDRHIQEKDTIPVKILYSMVNRFEAFGRLLMSCSNSSSEEFPLLTLVRRLQSALSSTENFPIISNHTIKMRNSYATIPFGCSTSYPCLKVQFVKENGEDCLSDYPEEVVTVDPFLPLDAIEAYLWPRVSDGKTKDISSSCTDSSASESKTADRMVSPEMVDVNKVQDHIEPEENNHLRADGDMSMDHCGGKDSEDIRPKLQFCLEGQQLNHELTLYQSIVEYQAQIDNITRSSLWTHTYKVTYRRCASTQAIQANNFPDESQSSIYLKRSSFCQSTFFASDMFASEFYMKTLGSTYDILFLLKCLEAMNRVRSHLMSHERLYAFAERNSDDLDKFNISLYGVSQTEFVNSKLTEKLEQQMRDPMTVSVGALPAWCTQLMAWCPFLFGFEARCRYFQLAAFSRLPVQTLKLSNGRQHNLGNTRRKKFVVHRNNILESAAKMMELHACQNVPLEVEYDDEVGTGLGPTLEFYTLVCREFQRSVLGMWRDNHILETESSGYLVSPYGLFPRPWSPSVSTSSSTYSEVIKNFGLLGQIVAKALQDGRILDLPFSTTFYKLILGKELTIFDVQSIDPAFGRTLLEFQAVVERKRYLRSLGEETADDVDACFRSTRIEDLCLDFSLPGYPDYYLPITECDSEVNLFNLEEYVARMVDATTKYGIRRQVDAFVAGFDQVFPIRHLRVFTEEELERLLCGEHVLWNSEELSDQVKFDHGYTISSPPIINLLEIMQEFDREQQRAFLQFVTGAPRLPPGGLASLNPKLTIVRKHCSKWIDAELPSVMTCANYLKLPPYSSKKIMKEKLLYAITEGQGAFHLS